MISIYSTVSWIYMPCSSINLRYPCIFINLPSISEVIHWCGDWVRLEMQFGYWYCVYSEIHSEAVNKQGWTCTWSTRPSNKTGSLGGCDAPRLGMYLEADDMLIQRYTSTRWMVMLWEEVSGSDWVNLEMHSEAVINRVGMYTGRVKSIKIGGECWSSRSAGGRSEWSCSRSWDSMY
jgi:hypothetical protein